MSDSEEIRNAVAAYDFAFIQLSKCIPGKQGFGLEAKFGDAYQTLVRLGVRPQIRRKYRNE